MRFRAIACSCLLIAVSAGGVKTMAASPDCARWIKDYQQGLAKRAVLAKKHVVHAAHRVGVPVPRLVRTGAPTHKFRPPRLSPAEMLKRFKVLCGEDLPGDVLPVSFAPNDLEAALLPLETPDAAPLIDNGSPVSFTPEPAGGGPAGAPPVPPVPPTFVTPPPIITPPGGGGGFPNTPVIPGTPITPGTPAPPDVPVIPAPVPEPGSLLLVLTGALAAVPAVMRRRR